MARTSTSGQGRPKGALNKTTGLARDAITWAAEKIGGKDRLAKWIKEDKANERVFWGNIYPRLLPLQVTGENGMPVLVQMQKKDDAL